jgi:F0F1-type ATP synthase beta subunit
MASLIGISELSKENQKIYKRAQIIKNYMTQVFITASNKRKTKETSYVSRDQAVSDVEQILAGKFDNYPPLAFKNILTLKDVKQQ